MIKDFVSQGSIWTVNLLAATIPETGNSTIDNINKIAQTVSFLATTAVSLVLLYKNKKSHKELLQFLLSLLKRK